MTRLAAQAAATAAQAGNKDREAEFDKLKQRIHSKLVDKLDLSHVGDLEGEVLRRYPNMDPAERNDLIKRQLAQEFGLIGK